MIDPRKCSKFRAKRDEALAVLCKLDDLPDDPNTWTDEQKREARSLALRLAAPESFLRRFVRAEL